jgi:hypothetical protein
MRKISLLVLAAGIGKRYKGLKQVDPIGPSGETLLDYSLHDARKAGFDRVVFIIRRQIEDIFRQAVGHYWAKHFEVAYVFQELEAGLPKGFSIPTGRQKPWGTAHAVLLSRTVIDTPFSVLNADDFYGPSAFRAVSSWLRETTAPPAGDPDEYGFVGYRLRNTLSEFGYVSRAVCRVDEAGFLAEVVERIKIEKTGESARALDENGRWIPLTGDEVVSMNFWGFRPTIFTHLARGFAEFLDKSGPGTEAEYFIPFAVNGLLKSGKARIRCIPTTEICLGITYPEDGQRVRSHIQGLIGDGVYPEKIRG